MKLLLTLVFCSFFFFSIGQTTLTFKPETDCGKDAVIVNSPTWNNGSTPISSPNPDSKWLRIEAWTANSNGSPEHDHRSLVQFEELKTISNMDLTNATLKLYAYPDFPYANGGQAEVNDVEILRIIDPWLEEEVSWANQPDVDLSISAIIPQNNNYDFIEVNVTDLVQQMLNDPAGSFGFLLKQIDESPYGSMNFASSDYPDYDRAPELIITGNNIEYIDFPTEIFPSSDTTLCSGLGLILNVQDDLANSYEWQDGSTGSAFGTTTEGTYSVTINYNNCFSLTDTINVFYQDLIYSQGAFSTTDTSGCISQPITLDAQNAEAVSYLWSDGSTNNSIEVTDVGVYSVNIILENCLGLEGSINVDFEECNFDCEVKIPNVFTPDGDLLNDFYLPITENINCFEKYEMTIYNRWGNQVFTSGDPNVGWDGKFKNKNAPSDVYIYLLKYQTVNDSDLQVKNGDLTLIR
ncbi:MAG: DNRLRE domain-containing protein [Saprospiraceae bacterium]